METVLFTGGSGYLGSVILRRLIEEEKYNIVAVSSRRSQKIAGGGHWETADLLNRDEATSLLNKIKPDVLCHFAWSTRSRGYRKSEDNLDWLEASFHLIRQFHGKRLIYAGSSSEYELVDSAGRRFWSLYGSSKLMFETMAREYCREKGISFASGRIFTVYGPGDTKVDAAIPGAIQAMLRGELVRCNAPNNMWDYIYIDDAAEAMARLILSDIDGVLDIGAGQPISMRHVFQTVANAVGRPELQICNEGNTASVCLVADTTRMRQELGYTCGTPFEDGIARTVGWWKSRSGY